MDFLRSEVPDFICVGLILPDFVKSEIGDNMETAMDTVQYTSMVVDQTKAGSFYIVSHARSVEHIDKRYLEIADAYSSFAPRYSGHKVFDLWTMVGSGNVAAILGPQ